jgi:homoserine O-acetyltransferase
LQTGSPRIISHDAPLSLSLGWDVPSGAPFVRSVVPIACGASHTAWQIAISEVQRQAIYADPLWESDGFQATKGLEVARQIGMVSYRTPQGYQAKFGRELKSSNTGEYGSEALWQVKSYLQYQGKKFIDRFDPITYVKLTEQMDSHDVSRNRGDSIAEVLNRVEIPACVLGIDSDVLYPLSEQEELADHMTNSRLHIIHSDEGHDGFLIEQDQVGKHIVNFLDSQN